jgi:2-iminobutanoate/2-iminopropanoate deaminase
MPRVPVSAPGAAAVGPYSHAVASGGFVFLSGQTPLDPATGRLAGGDIGAQTRQCLANLGAVLGAAGLGFDDVVECHVFLLDMADFAAMNAAYAEHFAPPYPARTTIGVAALPLGARVEIRMVARARDPLAGSTG